MSALELRNGAQCLGEAVPVAAYLMVWWGGSCALWARGKPVLGFAWLFGWVGIGVFVAGAIGAVKP